jgi:hypothetical protein
MRAALLLLRSRSRRAGRARAVALSAALGGMGVLAAVCGPSGCVTSGQIPLYDGPKLFLPDGAPFVPSDGGPVACVFEELNTYTCTDVTLAPPVWTPMCVDGDNCATRVNGTSSSAGCTETTAYQSVSEIATSCATWRASDASLPAIDSGPPPVCAPGSVASFKPTWHPPRTPTSACTKTQIDSYLQCLNDAATTLNPPSCAEWSGALSAADSSCLTCLSSNESDSQYGPLVALPTELLINLAGCIALAEGKVDGSGCGGSLQADQQCQRAACLATCPTASSSQVASEVICEEDANLLPADGGAGGVCAKFALRATCAGAIADGDAGTTAERQCFGAGDGGTNATFEAVSLAFCGAP